eukprot:jgi/Chlat1/3433/Chrsp23S03759
MDRQGFMAVYQELVHEVASDPLLAGLPERARAWVTRMVDYNVPGGKLNRGLMVPEALKLLLGDAADADALDQAARLGWCIEWLQAFFLVADDVMDKSVTRRGQPCWYRVEGVGLVACNDSILLESQIYRILRKHFKSTPIYTDLLDLFHEVTLLTSVGQMLDLITTPEGHVDHAQYTMETHTQIVTYKTAYYSFYLPVACAMLLAGINDEAHFASAKNICCQLGQYFQIQDDYLDCFGDPSVIGKVGTDIEDNKCSWLVVQALKRANPQQKQLLEENYGKHDSNAVAVVKQLYNDLQLEDAFRAYEDESYSRISSAIAEERNAGLQAVYTAFFRRIYKREK